MARPNLLLCFDAFGTLFRPKGAVAQQYAEVARQCGITGFSDKELQSRLLAAIKDERELNPNYGKATGLGATKWWSNVIQKTFTPLISNNQALPPMLVPKLIHRFSSSEGYEAQRDLIPAMRALRELKSLQGFDRIVIGVVTNSDDRVPSVLSSFGLNVSPLRYGSVAEAGAFTEKQYDIDFHCMSYDVGVEKPDRQIFNAAEVMLSHIISTRHGGTPSEAELASWQKVYVGDEIAKDVVGATNAGWNPVLLDTDGNSTEIASLEDCRPQSFEDVFKEHAVVRSMCKVKCWFTVSTIT
ncbi:haloacid dehalogenase [Trichoderma arundinaceum]|uniref:Haloacid dehalogenase n=1 Tax=Trichoderma arundinaceum TaxID=490622 RepID=A0A395NY03_TRIAR|nr:haloacid dehalogenase [Trichoderma arundinaceum]